MKNYWLNRISIDSDVTYPLLYDYGYLSLAWSSFANSDILECARKNDKNVSFEIAYDMNKGDFEKKARQRWDMWYFAQFEVGDIIVVPEYDGNFSIWEIEEPAKSVVSIKSELPHLLDKSGNNIIWGEKNLLMRENDGKEIDIGFVAKVSKLSSGRRSEFADDKLTARMKMRQTNGNISSISASIEAAIQSMNNNMPLNFYADALESTAKTLEKEIRKLTPNKLELLVKSFAEKAGADYAYIPAKNENGKTDKADADVIAMFNTLRLTILIQVKKHENTTDEWAVTQISKYKKQISSEQIGIDSPNLSKEGVKDYSYSAWVISTCDAFSAEAINKAKDEDVRLINGEEFSKMLIDVGLSNISVD